MLVLLPPVLLSTGVDLIRRATRTIGMAATKLIATAGALDIAVVIAIFVEDVGVNLMTL
jgi:hypothetical protein